MKSASSTSLSALRAIFNSLLILLYIYAALSKLLAFDQFRMELYNQTFSHALANLLLYGLPPAELLTAALLAFTKTEGRGLGLSLALLLAFTAYIHLVMAHYWDRVPCSCGGILSHMSWPVHLAFNWVCIGINLAAIYLYRKERCLPDLHQQTS